MACKHGSIITFVTEDGEPGGLWGCAECNARFAPISGQIKAEQQRDELLAENLRLQVAFNNHTINNGEAAALYSLADARQQRDELLAALEGVMSLNIDLLDDDQVRAAQVARAAIANIKDKP